MPKLNLLDIKHRLGCFAEDIFRVPGDFPIHPWFLGDTSHDDFVRAFSDYRNIMVEMYQHAAVSPGDYGFTSVDRRTSEDMALQGLETARL